MRSSPIMAALFTLYGISAFAADPAPAAPLPSLIPSPALTKTAPAAPSPVTAALNDGSRVEFDADGTVWVLGADGSKSTAPDGTLTLKDGVPFIVRNGRRVSGE